VLERCDHCRHGSYFLSGKVEGKTLKVALKCRETGLIFGDKSQRSLKLKTLGAGGMPRSEGERASHRLSRFQRKVGRPRL
jgi:hypothetical protein